MTGTLMPKYESAISLLTDLKEKGFNDELPIDVEKIAAMLNIDIIGDGFQSNEAVGKIEINSEGKAVITLNSYENYYEPRRRFTIAHEIAHFCLHLNKQQSFVDTKKSMTRGGSYWNHYEAEANTFAAQLLMPKEQLIKKGKEIAEKYKNATSAVKVPTSFFLDAMANYFNVSSPAMEYRLKSIGIL